MICVNPETYETVPLAVTGNVCYALSTQGSVIYGINLQEDNNTYVFSYNTNTKKVTNILKFAEEDAKRKKCIDAKNELDALIFQIEKTMAENSDKIDKADEATLSDKISKARAVMATDTVDEIKAMTDELNQAVQGILSKAFANSDNKSNVNADVDAEDFGDNNDTVVDADEI